MPSRAASLSRSAIWVAPVSTTNSSRRPSTRASTWKWPPWPLLITTLREFAGAAGSSATLALVGAAAFACVVAGAAIRSAWRSGAFGGMADAVSDRMVDTIALAGTADEVRELYAQRWYGVYDRTLLWPPSFRGVEGVQAVVEAFAQ